MGRLHIGEANSSGRLRFIASRNGELPTRADPPGTYINADDLIRWLRSIISNDQTIRDVCTTLANYLEQWVLNQR